ncbi:TIR domain-containing protein [Malonomonas rubra DSM 5091]|uniref:TIR domain-containing protein n=1 Tax=Malonomonas rubra DSM 5091 TaxID=1122189 RepID=A0A1M6KX72_MALRU|nr:toll/interleukin-1 receptor domain-containing protein [Malonomonas rubra]SHJ63545.1 TIR domain-containing protein [Malonomonas rubra DSM 5091]
MSFYTKDEARLAAKGMLRKSYSAKTASQTLSEAKIKAGSYEQFDVFLSHSINDAELVLGVKCLLEDQGLKVYVDWVVDPHLSRDEVNRETAKLIRERMKQSKSLIYIATESSTDSKWMPWELGYFDGFSSGSVAILPLMEKSYSAFKGQEYLSIYPTVEKGKYKSGKEDVFIESSGVGWTTLAKFAKGQTGLSKYS